jgi:hypothetical protein
MPMAFFLGWVIYVGCLVLAVGYAVLFILVSVIAVGIDPFVSLGSVAVLVVPALVLYGLGRDFLYLLAGK